MIPVEQTRTGDDNGNCYAACLASILECPLEDVPDAGDEEKWFDYFARVQEWLLMTRGLMLIEVPRRRFITGRVGPFPGPAIMTVASPRIPNGLHAVVWQAGVVTWDPHPRRDMGIGEEYDMAFLVPVHPERVL